MRGAAKHTLSYLGNLGSSLPAAIGLHRGNFFWKRASGAEDELYAGVKDASGNNQLRRILTKTYADTLYAVGVPAPAGTPGMVAEATNATTLNTNSSYAVYLGRAGAAYTSISTRWEVTTGAATITWAEIGIGTSPQITMAGDAAITRRGFTDVSASFNSTGEKTVTTTVSGIAVGDHLWALAGSQATTPFQVTRSLGFGLSAGNFCDASATRISTMSSPKTFVAGSGSAGALACMWIGT